MTLSAEGPLVPLRLGKVTKGCSENREVKERAEMKIISVLRSEEGVLDEEKSVAEILRFNNRIGQRMMMVENSMIVGMEEETM